MPEDFLWNFHYHAEVELLLVFDGIGRRHVGNHVSYYSGGDLVLIGSNLPHSGFGYGALGKHEEVVVQFKREIINHTIEFDRIHFMLDKAQLGIAFSTAVKEKLEDDFRQIKDLEPWQRFNWLMNVLQKLSMETDFQYLNEAHFLKSNFSKDQSRILKVFEYVEKNFANTINTQAVADISNLTLPAFCNYFKKNLGVSFTDFLNEYRINQACILLTEGKTVSDVAFLCGFNSLSYFSRTFKNFKHSSPTEFQRKVFQKKEPR